MRWDDFRESSNVEDRRGEGGGGIGFPGGGAGGLGIGTIVILCIVGWVTGINPAILIGGYQQATQGSGRQQEERADPQTQERRRAPPTDKSGKFAASILGNTEDVWNEILPNQTGKTYTPTTMVLYEGGTRSGCGSARAAMGPFYCPIDKKVYLDTSFFQEMGQKFGVKGEFAYAYVIAHEVGHHVQDVLGILGKVDSRKQSAGSEREANQLSVRVELMADCLAGVWAKNSNDRWNALDQSDIQEALNAASAIGDDKLQEKAQGYAVPDSFTHGSSEQRMRWFLTGYKSGQTKSCDTFRAGRN